MSKRIFPSWDHISSFKDPISDELISFIKYLDKVLIDDIQLYVRPHLNEDKPDLVILNPNKGIMFYNQIDWAPGQIKQTSVKKQIKNQRGYGMISIDQRKFSKKLNGKDVDCADPIIHLRQLLGNLTSVYVPDISATLKKKLNKCTHVGLFLPKMDTTVEAMSNIRVPTHKCMVIGSDYKKIKIDDIIPYLNQKKKFPEWNKEWLDKIRLFLVPPLHEIEDGVYIKLSKAQENNIQHEPNKHRRVRGVAGSGKTLVVAQKAANIASRNKKVLIVTYNITLVRYILDQISRATFKFKWENITIKHFHGFCSEYLRENGIPWPTSKNDRDEKDTELRLDIQVPRYVIGAMEKNINIKKRKYDSIIIDEGQDFIRKWYECLCKFLSKNDELFYVVDNKQNLYKRDSKWTDNMEGGGKFNKKWRELNRCYRFPAMIIEKVNQFAEEFLPNDDFPLIDDQYELNLYQPHTVWNNHNEKDSVNEIVFNQINLLSNDYKIHLDDIVVLMPTHKSGLSLAGFLGKKKISVNHLFKKEGESNIRKFAFRMDEKGLKMSTVNSFKGWEVPTVILVTPISDKGYFGKLDQLVYTGLSRARVNLIVLNYNKKYKDFGDKWPNTWL